MSIEIRHISKSYGRQKALDDINMTFEKGGLYGLFGRNGAGKSTLLKIIAGQIFQDEGEILMDGQIIQENDKLLSQIYLMSELNLYPEKMRMKEALKWSAEYYPQFDMETARRLMETFSLAPKKKVGSLSTGYTSIYKLVIALSCGAPYILLDEPVLGLDAGYRDVFYQELLKTYMRYEPTIIASTHLIDEIANMVESVVILKKGRIIRNTTCEALLQEGYTVSGARKNVEEFLAGRQVLGSDLLGGLMSAYILGSRPSEIPEGLEISSMDLQKLFVKLTEEEGEKRNVLESL